MKKEYILSEENAFLLNIMALIYIYLVATCMCNQFSCPSVVCKFDGDRYLDVFFVVVVSHLNVLVVYAFQCLVIKV